MTDLDAPGSGVSPSDGGGDPQGQATQSSEAPKKRRSRGASALREAVIVLGSALILSLLIKTFVAQAFFIPSESMESTLVVGDRVLVSRLAPGPLDVNRGDIVVFVDPGGWLPDPEDQGTDLSRALTQAGEFVGLLPANTGSHLIKRVIGLPGDTVTCCGTDGRIAVNGVPIDEPYLNDGVVPSEKEGTWVVPEDSAFVLGDNRPRSGDSRYHEGDPGGGMVPLDNVVGVAKAVIWPADNWGILRNPGSTFEPVPDP